ncbi:MAG: hypothetical protein SGCHY_004798 [Lobulomycetales sp.]
MEPMAASFPSGSPPHANRTLAATCFPPYPSEMAMTNDQEIFDILVAGGLDLQPHSPTDFMAQPSPTDFMPQPSPTDFMPQGSSVPLAADFMAQDSPVLAQPNPRPGSDEAPPMMPFAINTNPAFLGRSKPMSPALSCASPLEMMASPASTMDIMFFPPNSTGPHSPAHHFSPVTSTVSFSPSISQAQLYNSPHLSHPFPGHYSPHYSPRALVPAAGYPVQYSAAAPGTISPPRSPALLDHGSPGPKPDLSFDTHLKRYKCGCGKTFMRKPDLQRHLRNIHAQCWKCGNAWPLPGSASGMTYKEVGQIIVEHTKSCHE